MVHNFVINVEPAWVWANNEVSGTSEDSSNMKLQPVLVMVPIQQSEDPAGVLKIIQENAPEESQTAQWVLQDNQTWSFPQTGEKVESNQWELHVEQQSEWIQPEQHVSESWFQQQHFNQGQDENRVQSELIPRNQPAFQSDEQVQENATSEKEVVFSIQKREESQGDKPADKSDGSLTQGYGSKDCECNKCRKPPGPSFQHMFNCDICGKPFSQKKWLALHRKTHKKKMYRCTICGERFPCRRECNIHVRLHKGKKPYECYVCGQWFSLNSQLTHHVKEHGNGKSFQCNVCSKSFSSLGELNDHFKEHTNEAPSKCNKCGKIFDCKKTFALHLITHNRAGRSYECVLCGNYFPQASSLAHHLRTHSECNVCGKVFSFGSDLIEHLREHVNIDSLA